ncbi:MAG: SMP-30/gluconolactonase/LRE family protein, partial [Planctomycetaceae bacterium]
MSSNFDAVALPETFAGARDVTPATCVAFTEGPAAAIDGRVYFSDIANDRILRFSPDTGTYEVWRTPSGRANGLLFDPQHRLLVCEGNEMGDNDGGRRVTRIDPQSGELTVLTDAYEGCRYNAPNDICACSNGFIFFTDPCYGDRSTMETEHESVYRIAPDGSVTRSISQPDIQRPNGIALSPDETVLYVVDSCPTIGGNRKIWSFDLHSDGSLSNQKTVIDFAPGRGGDGMAVDQEGTLYIAAGIQRPRGPHETALVPPGIWIVSPHGEIQGRIPIPEDVLTNVTFGGSDLRTLYVTAGKTLFQFPVPVAGYVVH